ncbi:AraC family transcriptional regulator [Robertmurraya kyonggiensis]|uniref:Helix-turn-helix domain-containing protein n=1 Tax=Robertmurraya kyonggiensis TaxID=1037680 RepID=A0A4U1DAS9_9BACI|nr:AraC family transcriptional regulator [Robertmurraya kyonggiensis]TKC19143.1 helix-turn-helix domain-containing protein [Robertmurraya kyonggiensis]
MNQALLEELMKLTEEEQEILSLRKEVKKELYTSQTAFVIESEKFLSKDKMIELRKHTRFINFPMHRHDYIEINYVFHGKLKQKVGNERICLKQGELLFLNQHIYHEIEASSEEDIIINFIVQPKFFEFIFSYLSTDNIVSNFLINSLYDHTQNGQYLYFKISEVNEIQEIIQKMIEEIMNPSLLSDSTIKLYAGLLMIELIKNSNLLEQNNENSNQHFIVVETMKYVDEHYQNATLYELSKMLHLPHYTLSKQIKNATNFTFKELLQEKRLNKARHLLMESEIPIMEIVETVGYDNISYFYRIFKSKFGLTPKKLREQIVI